MAVHHQVVLAFLLLRLLFDLRVKRWRKVRRVSLAQLRSGLVQVR